MDFRVKCEIKERVTFGIRFRSLDKKTKPDVERTLVYKKVKEPVEPHVINYSSWAGNRR